MPTPATLAASMTPGRDATPRRAQDALALAACLLAAALVTLAAARPLATDDTWWHLKLGELYAAEGPRVTAEPMLHTAPDQQTVPHEWLFQVGLHRLFALGGFPALRMLHAGLVLAITAGVFWTLRRAGPSLGWAAAGTTAWLVLSWYRLIQLRPELVSLLALLALTHLALLRRGGPNIAGVLACLLLFVLWVNVHSLFAIGLALLFAAAVGAAVAALFSSGDARALARDRALRLAALLVGATLVTALNPQGFDQHLLFFTESASGDIWRLEDDFLRWVPWQPADDNRAFPWLSWATAGALLLTWIALAGRAAWHLATGRQAAAGRTDWPLLALGGAAWIAMLVAVRFHWLALFPLLAVLATMPAHFVATLFALLLAAALPGAMDVRALRDELAEEPAGYAAPYLSARYCAPASRFLEEAGLEGRLFHPFNLGGYLGYRHAPQLLTFIDGRLDHVPPGVLDDYVEVRVGARTSDAARMQEPLDRHQVDLYVGTHFRANRYGQGTWTDHLRRQPEWTPIFASQECSVYLRNLPRNDTNRARVAEYYAARGIAFDAQRGPSLGAALASARAWSDEHGVTPRNFDALREARQGGDAAARQRATEALARDLWRIGAFREGVALDRALVRADPGAPEPRRRLVDGLLQLGLAQQALPLARGLLRDHPRHADVGPLALAVIEAAER